MKLFNKTIDRQLFNQYSLGSDLSKQEVVVKIFNPVANGTWFILNSDPNDPDYLWAIVDLGYGAEVGSVSRSDLETYRGRFGLGFERDLGFDPINAEELYKGLRQGKFYADGGLITEDKLKEGEWSSPDMKVLYEYKNGRLGITLFYGKDRRYSKTTVINNASELSIKELNSEVKKEVAELKQFAKEMLENNFADGGELNDFSDNQRMIMNQNVEVEHHHEELEDILEDKVEIPAWVVAKMETATQNLSDITHYLDGQKELMEEEDEYEEGEEEENEEEDEDQEEIENKEVVEPINVSAGTKAELTKKFTDDAFGNLRGFLNGMNEIELRNDYTFDYKDEQFEVEPIVNSDENGVSNAVFTIFDGDGEEVGEVAYSRDGGKQKFTANSEFFSWNNAKFEDGGYFDGTIPKVSTYMSNYADGGNTEIDNLNKNTQTREKMISYVVNMKSTSRMSDRQYDALEKRISEKSFVQLKKEYDALKANSSYAKGGEIDKAEIIGLSRNIMGTTDIEMKISGMRKPQDFSVYPIGKDDAGSIITIQSNTRIGQINLVKGVGVMSQSHSSGAYFVHLQMDKLTSFTLSESDLEELKMHIFKTAGSNVGSSIVKSDNSGASRLFAKGGVTYFNDENQYRLGRASGSFEKEIFEKVKDRIHSEPFVGNFGWKTPQGKRADGYLYKLDDYDKNVIKNLKLKQGEVVFRYVNRTTAIGGSTPFIKINIEKALLYFPVFNDNDDIIFETRGITPLWINLIEGSFADGGFMNNVYADGGEVTNEEYEKRLQYIKMMKNNERTDLGKYKIDKEIREINTILEHRGNLKNSYADGGFMNNVYADGGDITVLPFYLLKKEMSNEEQENVDIIHDAILIDNYEDLPKGYSLKPLKSYRESGMNSLIVEVTPPKGNKFNLRVHTYELRDIENDGYNLKDINGKKIEVGHTVKTTQPSGGLMNPANAETGIVEKTKDAFGNDALQIKYRKKGANYDQFILLNGKINEIVDKSSYSFEQGGFMNNVYAKGGSLEDKLTKLENKKSDLESKLFDAQLKSNEKWNNIGWGSGMRKSKLNLSTTREDSLKERIKVVEEEIEQTKQDLLPKKPKYIHKEEIKTVTIKRNGKEVMYKGEDILNGIYALEDGGDIFSKATYIPKRDVVGVELNDGTIVKPLNGRWIKKGAKPIGAEPTPTASVKSETKVGETYIRKDARNNWRAETNVESFNDYDWRISTVKTYTGNLVSSAQGGKTEPTGSKGYEIFKYTMYQDPNHTLEVSKPKRLTDKVVKEQHDKALAKFKKFMETGMFKDGGKISNFDKLSAKVAKQYEGKPVKSDYQEEYGKYYSKEEAQEVGDKVAGKVKAMQTDKKESGGRISMKLANDLAKEIRKNGESWNDAKKRAFAELKK